MMNPSSLNIGSSGGGTFGSSGGTLNIGGVSTTRLPPYQTYYERTRPTYSYRWTTTTIMNIDMIMIMMNTGRRGFGGRATI